MLGTFYFASVVAWMVAPVESSAMSWAIVVSVAILLGDLIRRVLQ